MAFWRRKSGKWGALRPLFTSPLLRPHRRVENEALIRALCANAYLGDDTALCRVLGRYKMYVDTQDVGLSAHLLLDGYWEMWLTEEMAARVPIAANVIDVGANLGYFSILLADLVGPTGRVTAFEPNPAVARRLRKSVQVNGFDSYVTVHQTGLGNEDGAAFRLIVPENDPKNGYVVRVGDDELDAPDILRIRRLDSYPELLDADVVKIDADTAERLIWQGMRGIFDRGRAMTVFLEFNVERYDAPGAFLDEITAEGFSLGRLDLAYGTQRVSRDDILNHPLKEDQMLVMQR